jgi:hypothetical protein
MGTEERPRDEAREADEERPPPEDRDGGVDPEEEVADGRAGAKEAKTPGMGS